MFKFLFLSILVTCIIFIVVFYYYEIFDNVLEHANSLNSNKHVVLANKVKKNLITGENPLKCKKFQIQDKKYTEHIVLFPAEINRTIVVTTNKNSTIEGNVKHIKGVENENSVSYAFNVKKNISPSIYISHAKPVKHDSVVNVFSNQM